MSGTFAPAPGGASYAAQVRAQGVMETRLLLRNGEQLVLAIVIPVLALLAGVLGAERVGIDFSEPAVDVLTPGVLALAVMSTSFASLAIATGFERRYGVLKRLGTSPLPRTGLLLGKVIALLVVQAVQVAVISGVAFALGWRPQPDPLPAFVALVLGTAAFASLGLLIAGALHAEATLALANLVFLLLMVGGGVVIPTEDYGAFGSVVAYLPSGALGDAMRAAVIDGAFAGGALLVLALWAAGAAFLTARTFSWE